MARRPVTCIRLLPNADAALRWCDTFGDKDGDRSCRVRQRRAAIRAAQQGLEGLAGLAQLPGRRGGGTACALVNCKCVYHAKHGLMSSPRSTGMRARRASTAGESLRERFERSGAAELLRAGAPASSGSTR